MKPSFRRYLWDMGPVAVLAMIAWVIAVVIEVAQLVR